MTVLLMRTTSDGHLAPAAVVVLPPSVRLPVTDVPSEQPEILPIPPALEAPPVQPGPPMAIASVSRPLPAEPLPIAPAPIALPVASPELPAGPPVDPRPVAAVEPRPVV